MQRTASGLSVMHHAVAAAQIEKPVAPVLKFLSLSYRIHIISLAKICSFGISAFHGVYSKYSLSEVMRQLSIKDMFQGTPRCSCRAYRMSEDTRENAMKNKRAAARHFSKLPGQLRTRPLIQCPCDSTFFMQHMEEAALIFHSDHLTGCSGFSFRPSHRML